jgi:hypothetical protein
MVYFILLYIEISITRIGGGNSLSYRKYFIIQHKYLLLKMHLYHV